MNKAIIIAVIALTSSSCTWVKLDSAAEKVRVAYDGHVANCRELGTVTVSVKHDIAGMERNNLKVRDELETLARNEAATMHADTIKPLADPQHGEQRFGAYACR